MVVCDMWDDHWCKKAAARCGELAKAAEPVLEACRDRGMTIIHCPSDTMAFYKDHPARKRMQAVKKVEPPKSKDLPNPPLPVDDSDGGCDDEKPAKQFKAWTRQHAAITIDEKKDYITDNGGEVYSLMAEKGIDTLIVMGVHTNMCVLNRSFAIKQMVKWGEDRLPRPRPDRRDVQPEDEADGHSREGHATDHRAHRKCTGAPPSRAGS